MKPLVSMDGKGRCPDNVHIERFWRTVKWEHLYFRIYEAIKEAKVTIREFIEFYNLRRVHQTHGYDTPEEVNREKKRRGAQS